MSIELVKRLEEAKRIMTRQANALQAYLLMAQRMERGSMGSGVIATELYLANHEALKFLGLPVMTAVKQ